MVQRWLRRRRPVERDLGMRQRIADQSLRRRLSVPGPSRRTPAARSGGHWRPSERWSGPPPRGHRRLPLPHGAVHGHVEEVAAGPRVPREDRRRRAAQAGQGHAAGELGGKLAHYGRPVWQADLNPCSGARSHRHRRHRDGGTATRGGRAAGWRRYDVGCQAGGVVRVAWKEWHGRRGSAKAPPEPTATNSRCARRWPDLGTLRMPPGHTWRSRRE